MALKVTPRVVSPKPSFTAKIDGDTLSAQITKDGILIRRNEKGAAALRVNEAEFAELFGIVRALDEQLDDKKKLEQEWDRLNAVPEEPYVQIPEIDGVPTPYPEKEPADYEQMITRVHDDNEDDDTPAVLAPDSAGEDTVARAKALLAQSKVAS